MNDIPHENKTEDENIQELLPEYERAVRERSGDAPAMQAAVCIVLAASVFVINLIMPGAAAEIFRRIKELSASPAQLFPNPIELLLPLFD